MPDLMRISSLEMMELGAAKPEARAMVDRLSNPELGVALMLNTLGWLLATRVPSDLAVDYLRQIEGGIVRQYTAVYGRQIAR